MWKNGPLCWVARRALPSIFCDHLCGRDPEGEGTCGHGEPSRFAIHPKLTRHCKAMENKKETEEIVTPSVSLPGTVCRPEATIYGRFGGRCASNVDKETSAPECQDPSASPRTASGPGMLLVSKQVQLLGRHRWQDRVSPVASLDPGELHLSSQGDFHETFTSRSRAGVREASCTVCVTGKNTSDSMLDVRLYYCFCSKESLNGCRL